MHVALLPGSASTVRADEQARAVQAEISMEHVVKPVENAFSTPRSDTTGTSVWLPWPGAMLRHSWPLGAARLS